MHVLPFCTPTQQPASVNSTTGEAARGRPSVLTYAEVNKNNPPPKNEIVTMNENVQKENDLEEAENKRPRIYASIKYKKF